jgi:hypothetical protein
MSYRTTALFGTQRFLESKALALDEHLRFEFHYRGGEKIFLAACRRIPLSYCFIKTLIYINKFNNQ